MARFTATVPLKIRLPGGFEIDGAVGATHRIPDSLYDEFVRDQVPLIPGGVTWVSQDETSAIVGFDPSTKYDKTGGTISGAATVTGTLGVGGAATLSSTLGVTGAATFGALIGNAVTATTARFKGSPWYDVRAYGAAGDGVTDDTAAIQSVLSAMPTTGGTVFFPAGTYIVSSTLTAGTSAGNGTLRLVGAGGMVYAGTATIISVTATAATGISVVSGETWIEHIAIAGPSSGQAASIGVSASYNVHLVGCTFSGFYYGVLTSGTGSFYCSITDCRFHVNSQAGLRSLGHNLTMLNSRTNGGVVGVQVAQGASVRIESCAIEAYTAWGVLIDNAQGAVVRDNYFESVVCTGASVGVGQTTGCSGTTIAGNYFAPDSTQAGFRHIRLNSATNTLIQGNYLGTTLGHACLFTSSSVGITIAENTFAEGFNATGLTGISSGVGVSVLGNGARAPKPSASQTLLATTAIVANSEIVQITATAAITLTAAPTIADGIDGQIVTVLNVGANAITLQDQGTLASSNLRLSATTIALGTRDSVQLVYSSTIGDWVQVGQTNVL